jgi:hypothetical protein
VAVQSLMQLQEELVSNRNLKKVSQKNQANNTENRYTTELKTN